jgi:hypothetical protein
MFPLIRGAKCAIVMISKTLQSDSQDDNLRARYFAITQNESSRIVIRRIVSGQVISITTASSIHPHIPSVECAAHFSESFERNLDIPGSDYQATGADNPAQAEAQAPASRAFSAYQCAGAPSPCDSRQSDATTEWGAMRDLQTGLILSDRNADCYDSEGVAA